MATIALSVTCPVPVHCHGWPQWHFSVVPIANGHIDTVGFVATEQQPDLFGLFFGGTSSLPINCIVAPVSTGLLSSLLAPSVVEVRHCRPLWRINQHAEWFCADSRHWVGQLGTDCGSKALLFESEEVV
jgi:hypothetical protein